MQADVFLIGTVSLPVIGFALLFVFPVGCDATEIGTIIQEADLR
jgi:hypothetical protein